MPLAYKIVTLLALPLEKIDKALEAFKKSVTFLRSISIFYKKK
jgi:hypothetical protein